MEQRRSEAQRSYVRSPSRPNVPDPAEILSLYDNDEMRSSATATATATATTSTDMRSVHRPENELEGTLLSPAPLLPPVAMAVAVPVDGRNVSAVPAVAHASAVYDNSHDSGQVYTRSVGYNVSSTSTESMDREAKDRAAGRHLSGSVQNISTEVASVVPLGVHDIDNANAIAAVRYEDDARMNEKAEASFHRGQDRANNEVANANSYARSRGGNDGLQVDAYKHDYYQVVARDKREKREMMENEFGIKKKEDDFNPYQQDVEKNPEQKGYKVSDYETSEYSGYEYKSEYEYKSVYDK